MNQEIDRIKNDVETIQKAIGLTSLPPREWVVWLKRDKWLNLWWCLPGILFVLSSLLPGAHAAKDFGFVPQQWAVFICCAAFYSVFWYHIRKTTANDGRPQDLIREYKQLWGISGHGKWVGAASALGFLLFIFWAWHFRISSGAFVSGLLILWGMIYVAIAFLIRIWLLLGVGLPILACGLFMMLVPRSGHWVEIPLGITIIAIGLSGYFIQAGQIRKIECQNEAH